MKVVTNISAWRVRYPALEALRRMTCQACVYVLHYRYHDNMVHKRTISYAWSIGPIYICTCDCYKLDSGYLTVPGSAIVNAI